jgi:hypothetical protein
LTSKNRGPETGRSALPGFEFKRNAAEFPKGETLRYLAAAPLYEWRNTPVADRRYSPTEGARGEPERISEWRIWPPRYAVRAMTVQVQNEIASTATVDHAGRALGARK